MRTTTLAFALLLQVSTFAQAPASFTFQAVARDATGEALPASPIGLRVALHQGSPAGTVVFAETHAVVTTDLGLFTLPVGNGTPDVGSLTTVDWASGPWFLEVAMDAAGGTSYVSMGTQQLLSVPYALYAASSACFSVSHAGDSLKLGDDCHVIIPGLSAANGGCADADGDGYFDQAGCGTALDCDDSDPNTYPGAPELCDGLDNNCDAVVDEGDPQAGGACNTGLSGPCAAGTFQCQGGVLVCVPSYTPVPEVCDGIDNDCNGLVDDGLTYALYYIDNDGDGYGTWGSGPVSTCDGPPDGYVDNADDCDDDEFYANPGQPEVCDLIDNDCDGMTDEADPNSGAACSTGLPGVCGQGVLVCDPGLGMLTCVPVNSPSPELCDGLDNDCDGLVDEDGVCD